MQQQALLLQICARLHLSGIAGLTLMLDSVWSAPWLTAAVAESSAQDVRQPDGTVLC